MTRISGGLLTVVALLLLTNATQAQAQTRAVYASGYSTVTYGPSDYFPPKPAGGSITYTRGWSVSNSWNASVGVTAQWLSGQVGFQVDKSNQGSFSETFNMAPGKGLTVTPTYGWEV